MGTFRDVGDRLGVAEALTQLGAVRRLTGDYPGAARRPSRRRWASAASDRQPGRLKSTAAERVRDAEPGSAVTSARPRSCHRQALDLARQIGSPLDEAHALAGLGRCARAAGRTADAEDQAAAGAGDLRSGSARPKPPAYPPNWTRRGRLRREKLAEAPGAQRAGDQRSETGRYPA